MLTLSDVPAEANASPLDPVAHAELRGEWRRRMALGRIARMWATKLWHVRDWDDGSSAARTVRRPAFSPPNRGAFIRAYIKAHLEQPRPIRIGHPPQGGAELWLGDRVWARVTAQGEYQAVSTENECSYNFLLTSPQCAQWMADSAFRWVLAQLKKHYVALTSGTEPSGSLTEVLGYNGAPAYEVGRRKAFTGMAINAIKCLAAHVNSDGLRLVRRCVIVDGGRAELLTRADRIGHCAREAFAAYPALMVAVQPGEVEGIVTAVALQKHRRLVDELAYYYGIAPARVRWFAGHTPHRVFRNAARGDEVLIRFIGTLPDHLRPRSRADYAAAYKIRYATDETRLFQMCEEDVGFNVWPTMIGTPAPLEHVQRLDELETVRDTFDSLLEFFYTYRRDNPRVYWNRRERMTLQALLSLNRQWHDVHARASAMAAEYALARAKARPASWPPVLDGALNLGGLVAIELLTEADLVEEGVALDHCVADYGPRCFAGLSRLVSFRTSDGERLSTLELAMGARGKLVVRQHYAWDNTPPPPEARAAERALMRHLNGAKYAARAPWPCLVPMRTSAERGVVKEATDAFWRRWLRMPA